MKRLLPLILLATLLVGGFLLYQHWFPSDETRIKRLLNEAAEAASVVPDASPFSRLGAINQLLNLCTEEIEIIVSAPGFQRRTILGKDQLKGVMAALQASRQGLEINLRDLTVDLETNPDNASAQFIAQARRSGSEENIFQEFRIALIREDGDWKIRRVEPLQALGL